MPKELQHENEIKVVLDHQLSHDLDGLRSTYSFETVGNSTRSTEMLKTGQIPTEVNTMPGLIVYESEDERGEMSGVVNKLQARDGCLFCKKTSHHMRNCRSYEDWKEKNPNRKTGNTNRTLPAITTKKKNRYHMTERQDSGRSDEQPNPGSRQIAEMKKFMTDIMKRGWTNGGKGVRDRTQGGAMNSKIKEAKKMAKMGKFKKHFQ